jgi:hypothetical protein
MIRWRLLDFSDRLPRSRRLERSSLDGELASDSSASLLLLLVLLLFASVL